MLQKIKGWEPVVSLRQYTDFVMLSFISLKVPVKLHKDLVGSDVIVQKNTDDTSRNVRFVEKLVLIVM